MKFKLTSQIFVLFTFVIILSLLIFSLISSTRFDSMYVEVGVNSISDYINYTENDWTNGIKPVASKYDYFFGNVNEKEYVASDHLFEKISKEDVDKIIKINILSGKVKEQPSVVYPLKDRYFIVVGKLNDDGNYMVAIGDNETVINRYKDNSFVVFIGIFGVIILWGNAVVGIWSQQIVSRLKRIQKAVTNFPKTQYQNEIVYDGDDEISDLAQSIETMRKEIYHNEETKREMIQNVSHDIKTPIAVIKSYAEAIKDGIEDKEAASIIIKQSEILSKKALQLLEYNKLEYLESKNEFDDVNMNELIKNVIDLYRFQTNVKFEANLENVYFKGFQENYRTVLTNILDNAIRYAKSKIVITLKDNYLEIYNDGENIEESLLQSIYKPYEKGNKGQFGLGMSIVKRTLNHFDYQIDVKNHEIGVSFIIRKD